MMIEEIASTARVSISVTPLCRRARCEDGVMVQVPPGSRLTTESCLSPSSTVISIVIICAPPSGDGQVAS